MQVPVLLREDVAPGRPVPGCTAGGPAVSLGSTSRDLATSLSASCLEPLHPQALVGSKSVGGCSLGSLQLLCAQRGQALWPRHSPSPVVPGWSNQGRL